MAQPPVYNRQYSFSSFATNNPTTPLPGNQVDVELNAIKTTLDQILANIAVIQNDDTTLKNLSVGLNQMSAAVAAGFNPPKTWVTATAYTASPASTVFNSSKIYICLISHTAGTFATDLAAGKWQLILDLTTIPITAASQVSFSPTGGIASTDVQAALAELDTEKAATSHTHVASAISDSTAAGRNMLTAANVAAQQTLLGLGALAYLNSVVVTSLDSSLALTADLSPAALAANTNDWAPTNLSTSSVLRASASSNINLTGLSGGADGRLIVIINVGSSNTITLTNEDTNSAAANRFTLAYNVTLSPGAGILLIYDSTSSRWRRTNLPAQTQIASPTVQRFTSGTSQTYTPAAGVQRIRVRMVGGGGGGGAVTANNGSAGADTSFGSWTAIHGNGGTLGQGVGGAGGSIVTAATGNAARANTGSGGSGGGQSGSVSGAGGGAGEYVEFWVSNPAATTYTVGGGGNGGAAGGQAGGNGAAGVIVIEEFYA